MSQALFSYVLISALRERFLPLMVLVFALLAVLSYALGAAAIIEKQQFIMVFAGFSLRLAAILSLIIFSVFFVRRSFDVQEVPFFISGALGRSGLLLSYAAALALVAVVVSGAATFLLGAIAPSSAQALPLWGVSLCMEGIIAVMVSLFFSTALRNAPAAIMAVFGFYVLARLNGHLLGIIDTHSAGSGEIVSIAGSALTFILSLLPRLDLMGQGGWLLYGVDSVSGYVVVAFQAAIFCIVIFSANLIDFLRKQF